MQKIMCVCVCNVGVFFAQTFIHTLAHFIFNTPGVIIIMYLRISKSGLPFTCFFEEIHPDK